MVGLLLDLGQRTSVYLNGSQRGVMVAPGIHKQGCNIAKSIGFEAAFGYSCPSLPGWSR